MTDLKDLYSKRVMELASEIPRQERLAAPQVTVFHDSPICGSRINVDLVVEEGRIAEYGHTVRACTLGQASSSIMARHVVGRSTEELRATAKALRAMLKEGAPPPSGEWDELKVLEPARDYKARHGSILLPFEAVVMALDEIEAGKGMA